MTIQLKYPVDSTWLQKKLKVEVQCWFLASSVFLHVLRKILIKAQIDVAFYSVPTFVKNNTFKKR